MKVDWKECTGVEDQSVAMISNRGAPQGIYLDEAHPVGRFQAVITT
jgi:hypothetical protein